MKTGNAALNMILEELVEAVAERVAKKLSLRDSPAGVVYTTNKIGPHIPGKTRRWMLEQIKTMPGARRVGRDWEIPAAQYEAWATAEDARRCSSATNARPLRAARLSSNTDEAELERRAERALEGNGLRRTLR